MVELKVRITTQDEMLGTASANPDIHEEFIAAKAESEDKTRQEVDAVKDIDPETEFEKSMTIFPRMDGKPVMWDYQVKGFFKDACGSLRKIPGSECSKIKAYKKEIDGLIFVEPRAIPIDHDGAITICQRPLRAQTAQGERVALASSESISAGATMEFTIKLLLDSHEAMVNEMLDYGQFRGLGQWRNSGKGRFTYEIIDRIKC